MKHNYLGKDGIAAIIQFLLNNFRSIPPTQHVRRRQTFSNTTLNKALLRIKQGEVWDHDMCSSIKEDIQIVQTAKPVSRSSLTFNTLSSLSHQNAADHITGPSLRRFPLICRSSPGPGRGWAVAPWSPQTKYVPLITSQIPWRRVWAALKVTTYYQWYSLKCVTVPCHNNAAWVLYSKKGPIQRGEQSTPPPPKKNNNNNNSHNKQPIPDIPPLIKCNTENTN